MAMASDGAATTVPDLLLSTAALKPTLSTTI